MTLTRRSILAAAPSALALAALPAYAQKKYDTGASDSEVKIGHTNPYSGPASSYGVIGKTETAFFTMINEKGGINGRKINFISYDDGYSPPKTVEQVRKLVESDGVLLLFNTLGTPTNTAIHKYINQKKVPHIFIASCATKWGDPTNSRGRSAGSRTIRARARSTPPTSRTSTPTPRSRCSTRTTTTARIISKASRTGSATRPDR